MRVHEKALDDYDERFPGELAEACVADLLRARVVLEDADAMINLQEQLDAGISVSVEEHNTSGVFPSDNIGTLSLVRSKPKFAHDSLDPMRESMPCMPPPALAVLIACGASAGRLP